MSIKKIKSEFIGNVITLMTGSGLAKLITLILYPVLTVIYDPSDFGIFGLYTAILIIIAVIVNGGYEHTIMLPESDKDAWGLFTLGIIITFSITIIFLLVILFAGNLIAGFLNSEALSFWLLILPLSIFLEGFIQIANVMLNRLKHYKLMAMARLIQAIVMGVISITLGLVLTGEKGLLAGFILGHAASALLLITFLSKHILKNNKINKFNTRNIFLLSKSYKDFFKYSVSASLLNTVSKHIPYFLLAYFYGNVVVGYFTLVHKVLNAPVGIIRDGISPVYFQKATEVLKHKGNHLYRLSLQVATWLFSLVFLPSLLIIFFGEQIFIFLFGEIYNISGKYASWLIIWISMLLITTPLTYLVDVKRRLKSFFYFNIVLFIIQFILLIIGGIFLSDINTIAIYSVFGFLYTSFLLIWLILLSKKN